MTTDHAIHHRNDVRRRLAAAALDRLRLILILTASCATLAHAQTASTVPTPWDAFRAKVVGNTTTVGFGPSGTPVAATAPTALGGTSGWSYAGNFGTGRTSSSLVLGATGTVPVGTTGSKVPVTMVGKISGANVAKGFGKLLAVARSSGSAHMFALLAAVEIADWLTSGGVERNPDTTDTERPFMKSGTVKACRATFGGQVATAASCLTAADAVAKKYFPGQHVEVRYEPYYGVYTVYQTGTNNTYGNVDTAEATMPGQPVPATYADVESTLAAAQTRADQLSAMYREGEKRRQQTGVNPFVLDAPSSSDITTTGPAKLDPVTDTQTNTKTVTGADGRPQTVQTTKTTTKTADVTYSGDKIKLAPKETVTTKVKTTDADGKVTETTSTEVNTEEAQSEQPPEESKESDLCKLHPEILACKEIDVPEGEIPKKTRELTYQEESIFGSGACPADRFVTIAGQQLKVADWQRDCQLIAAYYRPLFLAIGALISFFILIPARTDV